MDTVQETQKNYWCIFQALTHINLDIVRFISGRNKMLYTRGKREGPEFEEEGDLRRLCL